MKKRKKEQYKVGTGGLLMANEMRDRLVGLLKKADKNSSDKLITDYEDAIQDNADYLIENGVIVLPCKVGETVWFIRDEKTIETKVEKIVLKNKGVYLKLGCNAMYETSCNSIGKTVFLTKEEAEQKLKGGVQK